MPDPQGELIQTDAAPATRATPVSPAGMDLLLEAGAILASSLDLATTMGQVARLTVPALADMCVIDMIDADGSIRDVAVAATQGRLARELEGLRSRFPLDQDGRHPVARVIAGGEPVLLARMSSMLLRSFAQGSEHARFMIDHGYHSAIVAPLLARGRTLGAISVLRLGDSDPYTPEDRDLTVELARRAALAIDNARLYSDLRRIEQRLEAVLAGLAEAITIVDEHGRTVFANQAAAELLRVQSPEDLLNLSPGSIMARFEVRDEHGAELGLEQMPARRLFAGEQPQPLLVRNTVRETGEERWLIVRSSPVIDPDSGRTVFAVNVLENITALKRGQLTERFMAEAGRVLASSTDYRQTLEQVARMTVPQIADWCAIALLGEQGEIEQVAVHHADPGRLEIAEQLDRSYRPLLDEPAGVPEVIRTGQTRVFTDIDPQALAAYARDDRHLQLLSSIGARTVIIAPISGANGAIGAITLVSQSVGRLSEADVAFAERLGRRVGTAVENARHHAERASIAHTLQRSLLPDSLPRIPSAQLAARYHAAGELNEVGGDFYDVLDYGPGRWILMIGDVCGKGPRAAAVTALARHTLRSAALGDQSPSEMLATLHRSLRRQPAGADLCTVCLVVLEPDGDGESARLTVALAGHPPPVLIGRDGTCRQIGTPGTLLGVLDPIRIGERHAELRAGETLLLYTDGVTDAGNSRRRLGEDGLIDLCRTAPRGSLELLLEHVERGALEYAQQNPKDDLALLGVSLGQQPTS